MSMMNENATLKNIPIQLLDEMERTLSALAARWRSRQNTDEANALVHQYQVILRCMIELGYRDSLDVDAELPDEHMPTEYFALFE
jgi:hypothetical protein